MWDWSETPFDTEFLELPECYMVAGDDLGFDDYELGFELLSLLLYLEAVSLSEDYDMAYGPPPL